MWLGLRLLRLWLLVLGLALAVGLRPALVPLAAATAAMAAQLPGFAPDWLPALGPDSIFPRHLRLVLLCCHACTSWTVFLIPAPLQFHSRNSDPPRRGCTEPDSESGTVEIL